MISWGGGGRKEKILIIASFCKGGDGGSTVGRQHGPRFLALTLSTQGFFCYVIRNKFLKKIKTRQRVLDYLGCTAKQSYQLLQSQRPFYSHT